MNYDRPAPAISAPGSGNQFQMAEGEGGGACAAVSIFIIWFVICLDSCYGNHCSNHCTGSRPHCKSFNDRFDIFIIVGQKSIYGCWQSRLNEYITHLLTKAPRSTKIYFSPPLQRLRIRAWRTRSRLQLFSGWRASRAPVNHRLLYLGHSKSSCVMPLLPQQQ